MTCVHCQNLRWPLCGSEQCLTALEPIGLCTFLPHQMLTSDSSPGLSSTCLKSQPVFKMLKGRGSSGVLGLHPQQEGEVVGLQRPFLESFSPAPSVCYWSLPAQLPDFIWSWVGPQVEIHMYFVLCTRISVCVCVCKCE